MPEGTANPTHLVALSLSQIQALTVLIESNDIINGATEPEFCDELNGVYELLVVAIQAEVAAREAAK